MITLRVISLALLALLSTSNTAQADGGVVRLREEAGRYLVTIFTSPTPVRQGQVDISVLVQDAASGECVNNAKVTVQLKQRGTSAIMQQAATSATATNKLFQAALFELPGSGWWEVDVTIQEYASTTQVGFAMEVDQTVPRWHSLWVWYSWPALAIMLFVCHQLLVWRKMRLRSAH